MVAIILTQNRRITIVVIVVVAVSTMLKEILFHTISSTMNYMAILVV